MVQRRKSEGLAGLLGGFPGILALGTVLGLGVRRGHPLKVRRGVDSPITERANVINNVISAGSSGFPSSGAWIGGSKLMLGTVGSQYPAMRVPSARLTPLGSERRKNQQ